MKGWSKWKQAAESQFDKLSLEFHIAIKTACGNTSRKSSAFLTYLSILSDRFPSSGRIIPQSVWLFWKVFPVIYMTYLRRENTQTCKNLVWRNFRTGAAHFVDSYFPDCVISVQREISIWLLFSFSWGKNTENGWNTLTFERSGHMLRAPGG